MDILSDVNIVGSLKTTKTATIGEGVIIGENLLIHSSYGNGTTAFSTIRVKDGSILVDSNAEPIFIARKTGGCSTIYLAKYGEVFVHGELTTNSNVYFNRDIYVKCGFQLSYLKNHHSGKIKNSFFDNNHVFGETMTIDVPTDCTRFFIDDVQVSHCNPTFDFRTVDCLADYFIYPSISVYRNNKKVDMDIEINTLNFPSGNEGSYANNAFTEVIIGNIKACSSDQQFKVAISPTFQFDN